MNCYLLPFFNFSYTAFLPLIAAFTLPLNQDGQIAKATLSLYCGMVVFGYAINSC